LNDDKEAPRDIAHGQEALTDLEDAQGLLIDLEDAQEALIDLQDVQEALIDLEDAQEALIDLEDAQGLLIDYKDQKVLIDTDIALGLLKEKRMEAQIGSENVPKVLICMTEEIQGRTKKKQFKTIKKSTLQKMMKKLK
jgi:hypothetical protein